MLTIIPHPDAAIGKAAVRAVQEQLRDAGFSPGAIDGVVGSKTRAAWSKWWGERIRQIDSSKPAHLALAYGLNDACQLVRRGTDRAEVLVRKGGGTSTASAWCAYGAAGWYHEAAHTLGVRLLTKTSGGVVKWWHRLTPEERIPVADVREGRAELEPGDLFFRTRIASTVPQALAGGTPVGHCGLVEREGDNGDPIWTVEANTNGGDSATGGRVVAKTVLDLWDPRLLGFGRMRFG
jgi:hypothetical protein